MPFEADALQNWEDLYPLVFLQGESERVEKAVTAIDALVTEGELHLPETKGECAHRLNRQLDLASSRRTLLFELWGTDDQADPMGASVRAIRASLREGLFNYNEDLQSCQLGEDEAAMRKNNFDERYDELVGCLGHLIEAVYDWDLNRIQLESAISQARTEDFEEE
jgi:hypothetical protein